MDLNDEILALMGNAPSSKNNNSSNNNNNSKKAESYSSNDSYDYNKRESAESSRKSRRTGRFTRTQDSDLSSSDSAESEDEAPRHSKKPLTNLDNEAHLYDLEEQQEKDRESDLIQQRLAQVRNNANSTMANLQQSSTDRRSNRRDTTKSQNLDELRRRRHNKFQGNSYSERYDYDDDYNEPSRALQPSDLLTIDQARSIQLTRTLICDYSKRKNFKEKIIDAFVRINVSPGEYCSDSEGYCLGKITEVTVAESGNEGTHTHTNSRKYNVVLEFLPSGTMTIPIDTVSNSKCGAKEVELYAQELLNQGVATFDIAYIVDNLRDLEESEQVNINDINSDPQLAAASDEATRFADFCRDPKIYTQVANGTYTFTNIQSEIEYCYNQTLSLRFKIQNASNSIGDPQKRNAILNSYKVKNFFWTKKHDDAKIKLQRSQNGNEIEQKTMSAPVFTSEELNTKLYTSTYDKKVFDYNSRFPPSKHDNNKRSALNFLDDFCDNNHGILSNHLSSSESIHHYPSDFQLAILKTKDEYKSSSLSKY